MSPGVTSDNMSRPGVSSSNAARIPAMPPTAARIGGSSKNENNSVKTPCTKSVMIAARSPPARPYTTNSTVISTIEDSAEIKEPVQASITAAPSL